ncbi:MAG: SEC-C domain-containing protein [Lentisphaeria bacterium]|nr:SEC-C domain-containing protein [Lentisphaeria bacterium]
MTVGRDDPCPCGSGMKFRKCCAAKAETAPAGLMAEVSRKGKDGIFMHRRPQ